MFRNKSSLYGGFYFFKGKLLIFCYIIEMLLITKNSVNTVTVTLTEKATLTSPVYLFRLQSDIDGNVVRFIAQDTSLFTDRYNQFSITETSGTVTLTSGIVTLEPSGSWTYTIYEQTSTTNLDETQSTGIVEMGKVTVIGSGTNYAKYDEPITYKGYDGN